jgi:hypothetical protein
VNYAEIRKINVNDHIEKKNGLSYLSWAWAVDQLLMLDPKATWEYSEPKQFGETLMVFCTVTAFGKPMTAQLPVMDYRNKAIPNPDAFAVNTAMQRCLAKAIALHGLGLYIYAGEDLPDDDKVHAPTQAITPTAGALDGFNANEKELINQFAEDVADLVKSGDVATACSNMETLENEEKLAVWSLLDSKVRSTIKSFKGAK